MSPFDLAAIFMALVAVTGWVNTRFVRLPPGVAMMLVGLAGSLVLHFIGASQLVVRVNFPETVVGYMLAFLLFAGGMQVDLGEMRRRRLSILTLATIGVLASTFIVGIGLFYAARALGVALPLPWAIVFGALISPTDPIGVLATVSRGGLSSRLRAILQGEALFNDGVAIVVFLAALAFVRNGATPDLVGAAGAVCVQGLSGVALGLAGGFVCVWAMRSIDDYAVEVAISIALAAGVYSAGQALHVSGAIAAVAAGLIVGDYGTRTAMSEVTQRYVHGFWTLIDEILNALLFLLLGMQVLVLPFDLRFAGLWAVAIPLVLLARLVTVLPWGAYFHVVKAERGSSLVLAWGGLRGALSLALALEAPRSPSYGMILSLTYAVVAFAVVIQGLTFGPLVRWLDKPQSSEPDAPA